jgi:hypothetical protein
MKKKIFLPLTIVSIALLCAFSPGKKHYGYQWWDFIGTPSEQYDPNKYVLDPNNTPDCPPSAGSIFCEVYAQADIDSEPDDLRVDLSTMSNYRMKFF